MFSSRSQSSSGLPEKLSYLSYQRIATQPHYSFVEYKGYEAISEPFYRAYIHVKGPVTCRYRKPPPSSIGLLVRRSTTDAGWKLHINIYDPEGDESHNLEKAWDIIIKQMRAHEVYYGKVVREDARAMLRGDKYQQGKAVTIYCHYEDRPSEAWQQFIQKTTAQLASHGIIPAAIPLYDDAIIGSNYFSIKNDGPKDIPNPLHGVVINVEAQPARMAPITTTASPRP